MHVVMEKIILGKHSGFRTAAAEGDCPDPPEVGKRFVMFAKSLTEGASVRVIETTPITKLESPAENEYVITTESGSQYKLKLTDIEVN